MDDDKGWMNDEWMNGQMGEQMNKMIKEWMSGWMSESEWVNEWTNEWKLEGYFHRAFSPWSQSLDERLTWTIRNGPYKRWQHLDCSCCIKIPGKTILHFPLETSHDIYQSFIGEPHGIEILVNLGHCQVMERKPTWDKTNSRKFWEQRASTLGLSLSIRSYKNPLEIKIQVYRGESTRNNRLQCVHTLSFRNTPTSVPPFWCEF